jgi:hypothetical protein
MTKTIKIETYNLKRTDGSHIRRATNAIFPDGREVRFTEKMSKRQVVNQIADMERAEAAENKRIRQNLNERRIKSMPPVPGWSDFCKRMGCTDRSNRS